MTKRKLYEIYLEDKYIARKRKLHEIQHTVDNQSKKPRLYPQFELLAAHFKGYLERKKLIRMIFHFYS